jgi:Terminase small subunit
MEPAHTSTRTQRAGVSRPRAAGAARLLRTAKVRALVEALSEARWTRLEMKGDEALACISLDARADIRELFDEHGRLLNSRLWPDSVAHSVKAYRSGPFGPTIVMNDSLAARRIILEQSGRLKSSAETQGSTLARILAGHYKDED